MNRSLVCVCVCVCARTRATARLHARSRHRGLGAGLRPAGERRAAAGSSADARDVARPAVPSRRPCLLAPEAAAARGPFAGPAWLG